MIVTSVVVLDPTRPADDVADAVMVTCAVKVPEATGQGLTSIFTRSFPVTPLAVVSRLKSLAADPTDPSSVIVLPSPSGLTSCTGFASGLKSLVEETTPSVPSRPAIRPAKIIPPSDGVSAARARPPNLPTKPGVVAPFCTRPTIAVVIAV